MIYILPFIAAFLGWFGMKLIVGFLFRPKAVVSFAGLKLQGLIPAQQAKVAQKLGKLVATELISIDDIAAKLSTPDTLQNVLPVLESHVDNFIHTKLKEEIPLLSMFIKEKTMQGIKDGIINEIQMMFPVMITKLTENMKRDLDIENAVSRKIQSISAESIEQNLKQGLKKEFLFLEITGAVLGLLIGLIQLLLGFI